MVNKFISLLPAPLFSHHTEGRLISERHLLSNIPGLHNLSAGKQFDILLLFCSVSLYSSLSADEEPYTFLIVIGFYDIKRIHRYCLQQRCIPGGSAVKNSACECRRHRRHELNLWAGKIPWRRKWQPAPVFLPGKSHGQRSLVGNSMGLQTVGHH